MININSFKDNLSGAITASGQLNGFGPNLSEIEDKLICLAATYCKKHSSDILYSLRELEDKIKSESLDSEKQVYGFRDLGVDSTAFVLTRLNNPQVYGENCYSAFWILDIKVEKNYADFMLYEASLK